jgi:hypothetical protein
MPSPTPPYILAIRGTLPRQARAAAAEFIAEVRRAAANL